MTDGDLAAARVRREEFGFDDQYGEMAISAASRIPQRETGDKIGEVIVGVWECPRCTALVTDPDKHIDWHEELR